MDAIQTRQPKRGHKRRRGNKGRARNKRGRFISQQIEAAPSLDDSQDDPGSAQLATHEQVTYKTSDIILLLLKELQFIETRAFPTIGYVLITAKAQVNINFVQKLNFNYF